MTTSPGDPSAIRVTGRCHVLFAFDIGMMVDLDAAEIRLAQGSHRDQIPLRRRTPRHFEYKPAPLRLRKTAEPPPVAPGFMAEPSVDLVLYDFGGVLVFYEVPLACPLDGLLPLAEALADHAELAADARRRVTDLADQLGHAVTRPRISEAMEDYAIYELLELRRPDGSASTPEELVDSHGGTLARILRGETETTLSAEETADALQCRLSYGPDDVTIVDWNAALVLDRDSEDVRAVLEYANVELLEMRHLDQKLDDALDQAYRVLTQPRHRGLRARWSGMADLDLVARLQVDSAVMFEGVNNAVKLLGDQYLARLYQLAVRRFHLTEWDSSILRKLQSLESIYSKMSDRAGTVRMETLEWVIILLFVVDIVLTVWGVKTH